jgi:hypothetical protein
MSGELIYFWPGWVAGPWGVYLIYRTISGLATGEPREWAADEERKNAKKLAKQERKALEAEAIARGDAPPPKPAKKTTS